MMDEYRRPLLIVALLFFVIGPLMGLAYCAIAVDGDDLLDYDDDQALVETWCSNIEAGLKPNGPYASLAALATAIQAGTIDEPSEKPPTDDADALDRWQEEHPAYVSSAYFAAIEGIPGELTIEWGMLALAIEQSHDGTFAGEPVDLVKRAELVDAYRTKHC